MILSFLNKPRHEFYTWDWLCYTVTNMTNKGELAHHRCDSTLYKMMNMAWMNSFSLSLLVANGEYCVCNVALSWASLIQMVTGTQFDRTTGF